MIKLKRFITTFLSGLLCVAMVGCSNNSKENKDAEVKAEFQKAIEKFVGTTFENYNNHFEISDPSILLEEFNEKFGEDFKSVNYNGTIIYDNKKDGAQKITDFRMSKEVYTKTTNYSDGSNEVEKSYIPGDGYKYTNKNGIKTKSKQYSYFMSYENNFLSVDGLEKVTMTKDSDKKVFSFNYKFNPVVSWYLGWDSYVRKDSEIERKGLSGTLTIDEKNNTLILTMNQEYVAKKTGATAKGTYVSNSSNVNQELDFPEDLDSYKLVE